MIPDWLKDLQPQPPRPEPPPADSEAEAEPPLDAIVVSEDPAGGAARGEADDDEPSSMDLLAALSGGDSGPRASSRVEQAGAALGLISSIKEFEQDLEPGEFVAMKTIVQGQSVILRLRSVAMRGPEVIEIDGSTNTGQSVRLLQHISQVSFLLFRMTGDEPPPRRRATRRE